MNPHIVKTNNGLQRIKKPVSKEVAKSLLKRWFNMSVKI